MRTTLNIEDDILDVARSMAHVRKMSVGEALSELARRGLNAPIAFRRNPATGFLEFDVPDSPTITSEDVKRMEEEEDLEYLRRMERLSSRPASPEIRIDAREIERANEKR